MKFKSGFVSIIGRPNAGKSTLMNRLLGEKLSIVTRKAQTTRNIIKGVLTDDKSQIVFIDTPGIHESEKLLNKYMIKIALEALKEVDVIVYMADALKGKITDDDKIILNALRDSKIPVILVLNKIDEIKEKEKILPLIETFKKEKDFLEIFPLSATRGDNVDELLFKVKSLLPEGPKYFPEDQFTDMPERFIVSEIIREKAFLLVHEEIPYSVAVEVESFKDKKTKKGEPLVEIHAAIHVEADSQKGIIIGKSGAVIKKIGAEARKDIEKLLGAKVYLEIFVKVTKNWTKKGRLLKELGYE